MKRAGAVAMAVTMAVSGAGTASATTPSDSDAAMAAFNAAYWQASPAPRYFNFSDRTGRANWQLGSDFTVLLDAYERTGLPAYRTQIDQMYTYLTSSYGWGPTSGWYNVGFDDAIWTMLPMLRAYQITGDAKWLTPARDEWNYIYDHGYDTHLGGGLYWHIDENFKSANTNGGMIIAGYTLTDLTGDSTYATKAKGLTDWMIGHLFEPATGQVYNQQNYDGSVLENNWSYNYGVFIGAMDETYKRTRDVTYLNHGIKALDYAKTFDPARPNTAPGEYNLSKPNGILADEVYNADSAIFKQDFLYYATRFITNNRLTDYVPWLQLNAEVAWSNRRADGLMGQRSTTQTDPTFGGRLSYTVFDLPASTGVVANPASLPGVQAVLAAPSDGTNVARQATATASTSYSAQFAAQNVTDGAISRHGVGEWASAGEQNPWVQLTWSTPQKLTKIVLFDRMNAVDNITSGTLTFSDGSSIPVSGIQPGGFLRSLTFAPRTVNWVRFEATGGTGVNVGLSEFQAYSENDLAYGKAATSSSTYGTGYGTANAVDNSLATRFSTAGTGSTEWYQVDLGSAQTVNTVEVNWEAAYAKKYTISVSTDGVNYTTVANRGGILHAGTTDDRFASVSARYVRITMTEGYRPAAQSRNFSFWAFKVFNQS